MAQDLRAQSVARRIGTLGGRTTKRKKRLPRMQTPDRLGMDYARTLKDFVEVAWDIYQRKVATYLPRMMDNAANRLRVDSEIDDIVKLFDDALDSVGEVVTPQRIEREAINHLRKVGDFQAEQLQKVIIAQFGVDVFASSPALGTSLRLATGVNVRLIKDLPAKMYADIQGDVMRAVTQGLRHEEFAKGLVGKVPADRYRSAVDRAELIARDQTLKFYGQVNKTKQESIGVTRYTWRTAQDSRVRPEHAAREGAVFSWDDPPDDGHPQQPIRCRCYAEPILLDILQ